MPHIALKNFLTLVLVLVTPIYFMTESPPPNLNLKQNIFLVGLDVQFDHNTP